MLLVFLGIGISRSSSCLVKGDVPVPTSCGHNAGRCQGTPEVGDPCHCHSRSKDEAGTDQRFLPQSSVFLGTSIEKGVRAIAGHCFSLSLPVKGDNFLQEVLPDGCTS